MFLNRWFRLVLAMTVMICGGCIANESPTRPIVRVAIGMDAAEVVNKSTTPIDLRASNSPFADMEFRYGEVIVTKDVDFEVLGPHPLSIRDVLFWSITTEFDDVDSFEARTPFLTLDGAIGRAKQWVSAVDKAGWVRSEDPSNNFHSLHKGFSGWNEMRAAFLPPSGNDITSATIGTWFSSDGIQKLTIDLNHKRDDGGPRYDDSPPPKDPLNDKTYLLGFSVDYSDTVHKYRQEHRMELRKEVLKQKRNNQSR